MENRFISHRDFGLDPAKKTITFRFEESDAAYLSHNDESVSFGMLNALKRFTEECNIVVASRHQHQIEQLKKSFGDRLILMEKVVDGTSLLRLSDVFIGSGGTMNWECALLGIPNISYTSMKYHINEHLIKKGLISRCSYSGILPKLVSRMLYDSKYREGLKKKSRVELSGMQDLKKLTIKAIRDLARGNRE